MKNLQKILQNKQIYQCACKTNLKAATLTSFEGFAEKNLIELDSFLAHQVGKVANASLSKCHSFQVVTYSREIPHWQIKGNNFQQQPQQLQNRNVFTFSTLTNKTRQYVKKELVGYSMQQMYDVVSDVPNYHKFVPYVKKSEVHSHRTNFFRADLIVGFPPLHEVYTSDVSLSSPSMVRAVCKDGRLFNFLLNEWHFSPGLKDIPQSCVIDFVVRFEFKTLLHSNIANIFFDLICDQMEHAFITEARQRFGTAAIKSHILSSDRS